ARGAADRAEVDATAAAAAADSAQKHADGAAEAAKNAYNAAVDAGKAADRAEEAARRAEAERRGQQVDQEAPKGLTDAELNDLFEEGGPELVDEYRKAYQDAKKSVIDYILEVGGQVLLDVIGYTDAKKCFTEGDVAACLWTVVNVGSLLMLIAKLPAVSGAIARVVSGLTKFLESTAAGRKLLDKVGDFLTKTKTCRIGNSFTPDTPVLMADGSHKPIEDVLIGDQVVATDPVTNTTAARAVTRVIVGEGSKNLVRVTVDKAGTIETTDGHPFWLDVRGRWLEAKDLAPGDVLRFADGRRGAVTAVRKHTEVRKVFNLTVADIRTFYVTAKLANGQVWRDILVHNTGGCGGDQWTSDFNLDEHYNKHGRDMGFYLKEDYQKAAQQFLCTCRGRPSTMKIKQNGTTKYYYDTATGEYGMTGQKGIITYFEPDDGLAYFDRQPGFEI
ncbi:polymorphic toxin-type HINT domain-containing protein, partial [Kibdelosporangium philippinense]